MKPYGMTKREAADDDVAGCRDNGRASAVYNLPGRAGKARAYRSLAPEKKARARRVHKRRARHEGKAAVRAGLRDGDVR